MILFTIPIAIGQSQHAIGEKSIKALQANGMFAAYGNI